MRSLDELETQIDHMIDLLCKLLDEYKALYEEASPAAQENRDQELIIEVEKALYDAKN